MLYPYLTLSDETEITHSHIITQNDQETVEVHFERPIISGFLSARCKLPDYTWLFNDGFPDEDILFFEDFLRHNVHLIYRFAKSGGIHCAKSV